MVGTELVGPRDTPGPKNNESRNVEYELPEKPLEQRTEPKEKKNQISEIVLTTEEALTVDLVTTRRIAAAAEERLAMLALKDARIKHVAAIKGEVAALARVAQAHHLQNIKSARLIGNKLIFQKEE